MKLFLEKATVISPNRVWVALHEHHMYTHHNLIGLLLLVCKEWKHDRHMVG